MEKSAHCLFVIRLSRSGKREVEEIDEGMSCESSLSLSPPPPHPLYLSLHTSHSTVLAISPSLILFAYIMSLLIPTPSLKLLLSTLYFLLYLTFSLTFAPSVLFDSRCLLFSLFSLSLSPSVSSFIYLVPYTTSQFLTFSFPTIPLCFSVFEKHTASPSPGGSLSRRLPCR